MYAQEQLSSRALNADTQAVVDHAAAYEAELDRLNARLGGEPRGTATGYPQCSYNNHVLALHRQASFAREFARCKVGTPIPGVQPRNGTPPQTQDVAALIQTSRRQSDSGPHT